VGPAAAQGSEELWCGGNRRRKVRGTGQGWRGTAPERGTVTDLFGKTRRWTNFWRIELTRLGAASPVNLLQADPRIGGRTMGVT